MKRTVYFAALAALAVSCDALAVGGIAQVTIIDRSSGVALTPHLYRGEYWVAGTPGANYAIEIRNRIGERILAVTSVDGVNVISGATAGWNQTGYVFDPGEGYQVTGWRKSDAEVAAFTFTASPNSYAERTGRPANVGVIGVAVFRERQPQAVYVPPVIAPAPEPPESAHASKRQRMQPHQEMPAAEGASRSEVTVQADRRSPSTFAAPAPIASMPEAPIASLTEPGTAPGTATRSDSAARSDSTTRSEPAAAQTSEPPLHVPPVAMAAPKLGTGHGEREVSYVNHTEFTRLQPQPNEVIRIRYDSFDNLVAMGIVARPHPTPPAGNPFPASGTEQYVPDPPGGIVGQLQ